MSRKRIIKIIFLISLTISLVVCLLLFDKNKFFSVSFLDVGQGDASLLEFYDGKNILIDGGPDDLILRRLGEELPPYRRKINFIIISHFHDDHIVGLISVLKRYQIENIIFASGLERYELGNYLFTESKKRNINLIEITEVKNLQLNNNCHLLFINPLILGAKENSNNSLVTKLTCNQYSFLFSGDNEKEVEGVLLASDYDLSADVFKASHHGSKTSNQMDFLTAVSPKIFIISVGEDNRFNHPSSEVLGNAQFLDLQIKRTDQLGTVHFKINLSNIR